MRLKILLLICVLLAAGWFIGTSWIISSQAKEIKSVRERLYNIEVIIKRDILDKRPVKHDEKELSLDHVQLL